MERLSRVSVLVVEDQELVREALAALLSLQSSLDVVGQAASGRIGVEMAARLRPDVVLLDVQMADGDGIWATREIRQTVPACRCLLLTTFAKDSYLAEGMAAGASGYLLKDAPTREVVAAIQTVLAGGTWIAPGMTGRLGAILQAEPISERERQVLALAELGLTNREISRHLFMAEGSIKNLFSEVMRKLGARNRVEALARARERGIIG
ncbi:MAG: response regulator transcription factor [Thermaerobacter sp.]|nr:response regulator transcription factor [Thermaerobacter sp.]